jgi:2-beta-glucuronyltransferase
MGYDVTFVTIRFSTLFVLSNNYLIHEKGLYANILKPVVKDNLTSMINTTWLHPTSKKYLYDVRFGYFLQDRIKKHLKDMDVIIYESNSAISFLEELRQVNPSTKMIYRVSDDIPSLLQLPSLIKKEEEVLEKFHLVSVSLPYTYERLSKLSNVNNVRLDLHGIDTNIFDTCDTNPYKSKGNNIVFVGQGQFDMQFLKIAYKLFPNLLFHIIGPIEKEIESVNVIFYGHMPFEKTIGYIKFADVGLITRYANEELVKTLTDSLKVLQYCYCKLPVIAPDIMKSKRKNWFSYRLTEESVKKSIDDTLQFDRDNFDISDIYDWNVLAKRILEDDI